MSAAKDGDKTPEEIEADIAETRDDLGDTVAAVADKADVKKQTKKKAKQKAEEVKAQAAGIKESAAAKMNEAKDAASEKLEGATDTAADKTGGVNAARFDDESSPGGYGGSAGDIGSGPTGDIRQNPEVAGAGKGLAENPLVLVAAAFVIGLAIGRITAR